MLSPPLGSSRFACQVLGLICPSDNELLTTGTGTAASSAWVIAIQVAGIKALPSIINACLLSEFCSYMGSILRTILRTALASIFPLWGRCLRSMS